jgi:predicted short-subunit dehydrogenase-like oxidoreductase (DUF2520 family)
MSEAPRIAVVGTGPVGRALATSYVAGGGAVDVVVSRDLGRARELAARLGAAVGATDVGHALAAAVVVVAVPDRALPDVRARLASIDVGRDRLLVHTSGALPGDALAAGGRRTASLHPLQSFPSGAADAALAARVVGTHWFHEGDGAEETSAMVRVWRGTPHRLAAGAKPLYHAGAAVLSNHAVALFDAALRLFEAAGVARGEAHAPLAALLAGTSANVASQGVPAALTGPIARGDVDTVRRHLDAVGGACPELLESYVALARRALVVARERGALSLSAAEELTRLLGRGEGTGARGDAAPAESGADRGG